MTQVQSNGMIMPKISYASTMIVEDHLKKLLASTSNQPFKVSGNKLLPRSQHSPFGDFPKEYLPEKRQAVMEMEPIDKHQQSIAATGTGKVELTSSYPQEGRRHWRQNCQHPQAQGETPASEAQSWRF